MAHYAIHIPIDRDPRFFQKHIDRGLTEKEAAYASLIEGMDKSLGDLLDWVDRNGEAGNTIIIFMSDNGGLAASSHWRDGELHTQNAPLRSGKGSLLEGGIREPMIIRWPGRTVPGSECGKYIMIEDFYPSIIEMAGLPPEISDSPDNSCHFGHTIDGRSFVPLIDGTSDPSADRALIWNYPHIWGLEGPGIDMNCAIRKNEWKLIYNYVTHKKELYDIENDISESHDMAAELPEIARQLSVDLGESLRKAGAMRPYVKSTGEPCPWPDEV